MTTTLVNRIQLVEERIKQACERSGRSREEVKTIAVTKYVSIDATKDAVEHGLLHLGENRWQDAQAKWEEISGNAQAEAAGQPVWHFVGSLQTNKVKDVIGKFTYMHSLDRLSLAEAINKRAVQLGIVVPCFIQVNVSGEDSKHGIEPEQLYSFVEQLQQYESVQPIGLMTMAPFESEPEQTRSVFRALRELRDELLQRSPGSGSIIHLSMGMSNDFEIAIEEGATWIRLGTILVGKEEV
ncbi:YggS family pyridoxal phosphate-dependent enzyme [Paenibacillus alkaliterrae]|uniref:YggS family pyridoxal phosphate-dependent enzyme n=1 Tax=Paenibacillus alkaliterrae TaxID=320909 RepID=UPI001F45DE8D|nr:YggS family pyridoxal phosphate-dependent enzyme [Paenibacillus alkaliterrae]MCF2939304.1 YggS family pyridoxal phosphate-dependent enzyme [Paenibacillus alkaliterrae]